MSGHTPGQWDRQDHTIFALDETGTINRFSAQVQGGFVCREQGWNQAERTSDAELLANARLIAAAPELLEALELAVAYLTGLPHEPAHKIASAIAKARGEA